MIGLFAIAALGAWHYHTEQSNFVNYSRLAALYVNEESPLLVKNSIGAEMPVKFREGLEKLVPVETNEQNYDDFLKGLSSINLAVEIFSLPPDSAPNWTIYHNVSAVHALPVATNILNNAYLTYKAEEIGENLESKKLTILASSVALDVRKSANLEHCKAILVAVYLGILWPSIFLSSDVIEDRSGGCKTGIR